MDEARGAENLDELNSPAISHIAKTYEAAIEALNGQVPEPAGRSGLS